MAELFNTKPICFGQIIPREYQSRDLEKSFELWDEGACGVLTRAFTGSGKSLMSCIKFDRWLQRSPQHRCMVISYEKQLVWQFSQEITDVLGLQPGIEMESEQVEPSFIPQVVVASRQTLMLKRPADDKQKEALAEHGIDEIGQLTHVQAKRFLRLLDEGIGRDAAIDFIIDLNRSYQCNARGVSRLWKFDPNEYTWLVMYDEAHKHAYHLKTVRHIVDWFEQNPQNKRNGLTATPKRSDNVSIGHKMFPGVSLDYPLWSLDGECAVKEGYAVPYKQRFIKVESIDFKAMNEGAGKNQEKWDQLLDQTLNREKELATMIEPLLDMCEERRTLIFSPSVSMAKNVAAYINARTPCHCTDCNKVAWYPWSRVADGAECVSCDKPITKDNTLRDDEQAVSLDGKIPADNRRDVYRRHQTGKFQFLSVCGLCVAKGTLVLTDQGEVQVQRVTTEMKLWDGVEFVSHDGVISNGVRPVIEYAGLKATGDHNVWTDHQWRRLADCKQKRIPIRVSGIEGHPVRESDNYYRRDYTYRKEPTGRTRDRVSLMWKSPREKTQQPSIRKFWMWFVREVIGFASLAAKAMCFCQRAMRESKRPSIHRLWGSRNQVQVCFAHGNGSVDYGQHRTAQESHHRSHQQQRALRTRESAMGDTQAAGKQPPTSEVFDILNAGPRHRFTANSLIIANCREGYNDPEISCVAIFRPVSKSASSLAEQMKGRGSRVKTGSIEGLATAEERLEAISESEKTDCLIVDLVGVTNLADCASTIQIYAEGLPDEMLRRAEELLLTATSDPAEAIEQAKEEVDQDKERRRKEREEQERRAEAARRSAYEARASYTTQERGIATTAPGMASDKQLKYIRFLGMEFNGWEPSIRQAGRIITQLKGGMDPKDVAFTNRIQANHWTSAKASEKQRWYLLHNKIQHDGDISPEEASTLIDRHKGGGYAASDLYKEIDTAESNEALSAVWEKIRQSKLSQEDLAGVISAGKNKRSVLKEYGGW